MAMADSVVGLVLAGGKSTRMGGGDKCLRLLGGRPVLARILEGLRPQVSELLINANGDASRFAEFGCPVVADRIAGYAGPLAGIDAGLHWVAANRPEARYVASVPADTPFFPDDLVSRLCAASEEPRALRIAQSETGLHYVVGLWPVSLAGALQASLDAGDRRAGAWTKAHGATPVFFSPTRIGDRRVDPFFNINAPEDLAVAETFLKAAVS